MMNRKENEENKRKHQEEVENIPSESAKAEKNEYSDEQLEISTEHPLKILKIKTKEQPLLRLSLQNWKIVLLLLMTSIFVSQPNSTITANVPYVRKWN